MTKILSVRLDDEVAALVNERALRTGVSLNQAIQDAIRDGAVVDLETVEERARRNAERYATVMERLK